MIQAPTRRTPIKQLSNNTNKLPLNLTDCLGEGRGYAEDQCGGESGKEDQYDPQAGNKDGAGWEQLGELNKRQRC